MNKYNHVYNERKCNANNEKIIKEKNDIIKDEEIYELH